MPRARSGADRLAVRAADRHHGRARRLAVLEIRPERLGLVEGLGVLGRMLHRNEQRLAVRGEAWAGRLGPVRAGEQQLWQATRRALGVDAVDTVWQVEIIGAVGRHPKPTGRVESDVVRA